MKCSLAVRCLLTLLSCSFASAAVGAENWPQWRGTGHDGISSEKGLPTDFSATKNIAWKLPLPGMSGATPIIWGERIFLTSEDGDDVVLMCVNTQGKKLWETKIGTGKKRFRYDEANQASPSPATDGQHVFAFFGTGDFVCCDFDGKIVWKFNSQERHGKFNIQHGMHITPLLHGDKLYHCLLHSGTGKGDGWWVYAVDKATGKEAWKIRRATDAKAECEHSYASPVLWRKGQAEQLIIHGCDYATAHRLTDGSEIWRLGDLNPLKPGAKYHVTYRFVSTPLATSESIIIPTCKEGPVLAVNPEASGLLKRGSKFVQWRNEDLSPDVPLPLVHDGLLYLIREYKPIREFGNLICLDVKTGKQHYKQALHEDRYRASPILADGKIYICSRDGTVTVVKPGATFEKLAVNKLPDQIAASPAIANGRIYIRGFQNLFAISEGGK